MNDDNPPPMAGPPDDVWGLFVSFHQLLTSVDHRWEPTFGPYQEDGIQIMNIQDDGEKQKAIQAAIMKEHQIWVRHNCIAP